LLPCIATGKGNSPGRYPLNNGDNYLIFSVIHYLEFAPTPSLLPFIECLWTLKSHSNFFKKRELIIPGGRTEMMFNLSNPVDWIDSKDPSSTRTCEGSYLLGPRNRHFFVEHKGTINLIGVRFRHGGLSPFTPIPMSILMNEIIPQDQLFGKAINTLTDRLFETNEPKQNVALIENFLQKRLLPEPGARQTFQLISLVKKCESLSSLKNLTEKTGIHYKKLERVFSKYTGYNPKNFSRVIRFYKALQQMKKSSHSLTGIGLDGGYYDQPHFIRDFKAFTGKSPTQFHTENPTIANLLLQSKHV
jgi:AraC-like DNA-binding protein